MSKGVGAWLPGLSDVAVPQYMHPTLSRSDCESMLRSTATNAPEVATGLWVCRKSAKVGASGFVLSAHNRGKVHHYLFMKVDGGYELKGERFDMPSAVALLQFLSEEGRPGMCCKLGFYINQSGGVNDVLATTTTA